MKFPFKILILFFVVLQFSCAQKNSEVQFALSENLSRVVQDFSRNISDDQLIGVILSELKYDTSSYFIYSTNKLPSSNSSFCMIGKTKVNDRVIYLGLTNTNFDSDFGMHQNDTLENTIHSFKVVVHCTFVGDSIYSISRWP